MVTLYYLRRHVRFLDELVSGEDVASDLSIEVAEWLNDTAAALSRLVPTLGDGPIGPEARLESLTELGEAASRYRERVYRQEGFSGKTEQPVSVIRALFADALEVIDHSIAANRRDDGLYHAKKQRPCNQQGLCQYESST